MSLAKDFMGAGEVQSTSYRVQFNEMGVQEGQAIHVAVNGNFIGKDVTDPSSDFDPSGPGGGMAV